MGAANELNIKDHSIIAKGKKLLESNIKMTTPNVLSEHLSQLEDEVNSLSMLRYLAIATVDVKNGVDVISQMQ